MKKLTILLVLALFSLSANSQVTFQKTFGSPNVDIGNYVEQTTDGGYIITGHATNFILGANQDIYLIKTDSSGDMEWSKTYRGTDNETATCVQQTSDGGYIICGFYYFGSGPQYRGFLIKTNSVGDTLWTKTFGNVLNELLSLKQTSDGGYIVGGLYQTGTYDASLVIKLNNTGNIIWSKKYGSGLSVDDLLFISEIQQTTDGGYIACGNGNCGNCPMFLLKLNTVGDTVWSKIYEPNLFSGNSVKQTQDGGYIIGGVYHTGGANDGPVFIKTDVSGNIVWNKVYTMSNWGKIKFLYQTNNGGYIAVLANNSSEIYLLKLNSLGNYLWCKKFQPTGSEEVRCVQQTTDGGYIFSGNGYYSINSEILLIKTDSMGGSCNEVPYLISATTQTITSRSALCPVTNLSIPLTSLSSIYVNSPATIENTLCTTVGVNNVVNKNVISVYPNPASNLLNLEFQSNKLEKVNIEMINLLGEKVFSKTFQTQIGENNIQLEVDKIPSGIYLLQIKGKDNIFIQKVIKE
jgi:hypothetical protein